MTRHLFAILVTAATAGAASAPGDTDFKVFGELPKNREAGLVIPTPIRS